MIKPTLKSPVLKDDYLTKIVNYLLFEIRSTIGKLFFNRPLQKHLGQYLQLECGTVYFKVRINSDFYNGLLPWTKGTVKKLIKDLAGRQWESMYVEAQKIR